MGKLDARPDGVTAALRGLTMRREPSGSGVIAAKRTRRASVPSDGSISIAGAGKPGRQDMHVESQALRV